MNVTTNRFEDFSYFDSLGYERIKYLGRWRSRHRLLWELANGEKIPHGFVVHHVNALRWDNRIENLVLLSNVDHMRIHAAGYFYFSPDLHRPVFVPPLCNWPQYFHGFGVFHKIVDNPIPGNERMDDGYDGDPLTEEEMRAFSSVASNPTSCA